jgi:hypothetical protein
VARLGRTYPDKVIRLRPQRYLTILLANAAAVDSAVASAAANVGLSAAAAVSDTATASASANAGTTSAATVTVVVVGSVAFMPPMVGNAGSTMLPDATQSTGSVHSLSGSQSVLMV